MDGGADVREFRKACIDERVRPRRSLLMRAAMSGARVTTDPAGNAKLAKGGQGRRSRCRDDAAAAAILAVAEGRRRAVQAEARPAFQLRWRENGRARERTVQLTRPHSDWEQSGLSLWDWALKVLAAEPIG